MLIAHGILADLISQLSSYSLFGMAPISWDQSGSVFKLRRSAMSGVVTVITLQLGVCLLVNDIFGGIEEPGGEIERAYGRIQRLSCALLLFLVGGMQGRNIKYGRSLVAFFNGLIAFEQKYTGRIRLAMDWKGKLTKYCCLVVRLFTTFGPVLITVLITVSETSSPLNLIGFLGTSSSSSSGESITGNDMVQRFITWTITSIINLIAWGIVVRIRAFWTCSQILVGCYGLRSALHLYSSIMTRGKLLRITKEKVEEAVIYRDIQILAYLFNEVHGTWILCGGVLLQSVLQSVALYLYVQFTDTMTTAFYFVPSSWTWTSSRLFIAYMVFDGIFVVFIVFGCCAEVYITSVQVKEQLQENQVFQRSEWFTQFYTSCPTIKLRAGSTNFGVIGKLDDDQGKEEGGETGSNKASSPSPSDAMMGGNRDQYCTMHTFQMDIDSSGITSNGAMIGYFDP